MKISSVLTISIILIINQLSFAQSNTWQIEGKVLEKNNLPIPFANVFINNSSIGTSTDESGHFIIRVPNRFVKVEIVASFIGFEPIKKVFQKVVGGHNQVSLILANSIQLDEVKVFAKHDAEWRKKWKIFYNGLMGESEYLKSCQILNPEVIRLERAEDKKVIAKASEPIIIINKALGLKIRFNMEKFESDGDKTYYSGTKFFEKLDSTTIEIQTKWQKNQNRSYNYSFRNFLVSLAENKVQENGFEIFKIVQPKRMYFGRTTIANEIEKGALKPCRAEEICYFDKKTAEFVLISEYPLMVFVTNKYNPMKLFFDYPYYFSVVNVVNLKTYFSENGWLTRPNGLLIQEFWGREGFSNLLPENYLPPNKDKWVNSGDSLQVIVSKNEKIEQFPIKISAPKEVVFNRKSGIGLEEKDKNAAFVATDIHVKITDYDYRLTIFDLLRRIPGLVVANNQGTYQIYFRGNRTFTMETPINPALVFNGVFLDQEDMIMNILNTLSVSEIQDLGAIKYGNAAAYGARGANGVIVINTKK